MSTNFLYMKKTNNNKKPVGQSAARPKLQSRYLTLSVATICRRLSKHTVFQTPVVHDNCKQVVSLIYTKQFVS